MEVAKSLVRRQGWGDPHQLWALQAMAEAQRSPVAEGVLGGTGSPCSAVGLGTSTLGLPTPRKRSLDLVLLRARAARAWSLSPPSGSGTPCRGVRSPQKPEALPQPLMAAGAQPGCPG